jgi:hypothetical protein
MLIRVKNVEYLNDYKLKILFSDKKTKIVDFSNWLRNGKGYTETTSKKFAWIIAFTQSVGLTERIFVLMCYIIWAGK